MQGKVDEDGLEDYNEHPEYAKMGNAGQHISHTPPQTPTILNNSDSEEGDEDRNDSEEGQEIEVDTQSAQQALVEQRQKQFDILSTKLEENGWKLRLKVFADPLQANLAMSMNASTRSPRHEKCAFLPVNFYLKNREERVIFSWQAHGSIENCEISTLAHSWTLLEALITS